MTPSCCLNPPLTKMSHHPCKVGGEQPPAHVAEVKPLVAKLGEEKLLGQRRLLVLHTRLWDLSTLQSLGSPARLSWVTGVTQQRWLGSPDGTLHCTIQQHCFQHPQQSPSLLQRMPCSSQVSNTASPSPMQEQH